LSKVSTIFLWINLYDVFVLKMKSVVSFLVLVIDLAAVRGRDLFECTVH
jgi:uncharacterized phage infection (PIP) family protein YhgE